MDTDLEKELTDAAGETHYRRTPPLVLNEVSLNGSGSLKQTAEGKMEPAGGYFRKRLYAGHRNRNEKPEEENLGNSIKIVFLRKRRKLVERGGTDGSIVRATNEHNHPKEAVTLYESASKQSEVGIAADLRTKYSGLRTVEIIYALLMVEGEEPELVRIPVKGSSLGSDAKAETTTDLYKYMASFAGKEHMWQYHTMLVPVFETGKMSYFAIDFKRGEKIDDETIANVVAPMLRKVRENLDEVDRSQQEKIAAGASVAADAPEVEREEGPSSLDEYPKEEDIDITSIPF
jgi:hypothetical protein